MHYQYYNSNALLVVNSRGKIRILHTPFRVKCISHNCDLKYGVQIYVDEVLHDLKDRLYFSINAKQYLHHCFIILMKF
jgi:hypothetical protein